MTIVHTILSTDERRKVDFFRHDDGTYGFASLKLSEEAYEEGCWYPSERDSECHASSLDAAIREAEGRVEWLSDHRNANP